VELRRSDRGVVLGLPHQAPLSLAVSTLAATVIGRGFCHVER
jgi:hypothetical protein